MAVADDVITLPRLREAVGGVGDSQDTILSAYRTSSIVWLERWTGRGIIDRTGYESEPREFDWSDDPDMVAFRVRDVKDEQITIRYASADSDPTGRARHSTTIPANDDRVHIDRDAVYIYSAPTAPWCEVMRFSHPVPVAVVNRGMAATDIPAAWGDAVALMVRALLDGSAYDEIANMSALTMLLKPWYLGPFMRSPR